jgi:hypothetical protein
MYTAGTGGLDDPVPPMGLVTVPPAPPAELSFGGNALST